MTSTVEESVHQIYSVHIMDQTLSQTFWSSQINYQINC